MPIETDQDRLLFLDPDEFGSLAVWTSASGIKPAAPCVFDDSFIGLTAGDLEFEAEGGQIRITLRTIDVPADGAHEDTVQVTSPLFPARTFKVFEFQPDGTGMTVVRLQE